MGGFFLSQSDDSIEICPNLPSENNQ